MTERYKLDLTNPNRCQVYGRVSWRDSLYHKIVLVVPDIRTQRSFYSYKEQLRSNKGACKQPEWELRRLLSKRKRKSKNES